MDLKQRYNIIQVPWQSGVYMKQRGQWLTRLGRAVAVRAPICLLLRLKPMYSSRWYQLSYSLLPVRTKLPAICWRYQMGGFRQIHSCKCNLEWSISRDHVAEIAFTSTHYQHILLVRRGVFWPKRCAMPRTVKKTPWTPKFDIFRALDLVFAKAT